MRNYRWHFGALGLVLGLLVSVPTVQAGTIEVIGTAEFAKTISTAKVSASVEVTRDSVKQAKAEVDEVIAATLKVFEKHQLLPSQYRAATLHVAPRYDYRKEERRFIGYQAHRSVELSIDASEVGLWLERYSELGFTQIDSPQYPTELTHMEKEQLLEKALKNALSKAQVLAKTSGQRLGTVMEITEIDAHQPRPMMRMAAMDSSESYHPGDATAQTRLRVKVELEE